MPSLQSRRADTHWLTEKPYAHRGLHRLGQVENSRAAFEAAIETGFGIELDVQASRDGEALVFHDYELDRLTGEQGRVASRSLAELQRIALKETQETIPSLCQILEGVAGRAPLLIEMKSPGRKVKALCRAVRAALERYSGRAAIMSFNPEIGSWFARHAEQVPRGLIVTESDIKGAGGVVERRLSLWRARPDFLAYDIRDLPSRFASGERRRGLPVLAWTVRSAREEEIASNYADQIIHELPTAQ